MLFSVLFAGLLAMNFFEPVAAMLSGGGKWDYYWDFIALVGLFAVAVTLRMTTEYLMPVYVEGAATDVTIGRWTFGAAAAYVTIAFLSAAAHGPLPREFLDFKPEQPMLFGIGPDRQWLGLTQYVSETIYTSGRVLMVSSTRPFRRSGRNAGSDVERAELMTTWSSFPMRYAMRREEFVAGQALDRRSRDAGPFDGPHRRRGPSF
ncbi:MAG: CvpA family protein [Planctomycetaceae bacterium]